MLTATILTSPLRAADYIFSFSGRISEQYAVDSNFRPIPVPSNTIQLGDTVRGSVQFSASRSPRDFNASGFSFYYPEAKNFSLSVSNLRFESTPQQYVFSQVILTNDNTTAGGSYDRFGLSSLIYSAVPFATFSANSAVNFQFSIFDFSGQALSSQQIEDVQPLTVFPGAGSIFLSFNDNGFGGSGQIVNMSVSNLQASLISVAAVPEPTVWALMIVGFGVIGSTMRAAKGATRRAKFRDAQAV